MKSMCWALLSALVASASSAPVWADTRVALVICGGGGFRLKKCWLWPAGRWERMEPKVRFF